MKYLFVSVIGFFVCHEAIANPAILKEADKCDSLFTGVMIKRGDDRIIAIDRIIKGSVSKMDFFKAGIETKGKIVKVGNEMKGDRNFAIGDRLLFYSMNNGRDFGMSVINKWDGSFRWSIDGKTQTFYLSKLIEHFENRISR